MDFHFTKSNILKTKDGEFATHYAESSIIWQICCESLNYHKSKHREKELREFFLPYSVNNRIIVPIEKQKKFIEDLHALIVALKLIE